MRFVKDHLDYWRTCCFHYRSSVVYINAVMSGCSPARECFVFLSRLSAFIILQSTIFGSLIFAVQRTKTKNNGYSVLSHRFIRFTRVDLYIEQVKNKGIVWLSRLVVFFASSDVNYRYTAESSSWGACPLKGTFPNLADDITPSAVMKKIEAFFAIQ